MQIIRTIREMQDYSRKARLNGLKIGFVPTMGFLHAGHMSLVDSCYERADLVVVSIFVNPTQFGPNEDLDAYPRDIERDEALCREHKVSAIFYPTPEIMYASNYSTWVTEDNLSKGLCARTRPTHFRGVTTVVAKLFNAVLPDVAVFGQKDAQQLLVIRRMVRDLNFPIEIIAGPIVREDDGLAMSSRNKYLSREERKDALAINRSLNSVVNLYKQGELRVTELKKVIFDEIVANNGKVDYIEIVTCDSLEDLAIVNEPVLVAVAAYFGNTRLIDNVLLGE
ncbi:MAG: pantoate--beta-alanine ligase [Lentisphaeria bacterium]